MALAWCFSNSLNSSISGSEHLIECTRQWLPSPHSSSVEAISFCPPLCEAKGAISRHAGPGSFIVLLADESKHLPKPWRRKAAASPAVALLWIVSFQFYICSAVWIRKEISLCWEDPYLLITFSFSYPRSRYFSRRATASWCCVAVTADVARMLSKGWGEQALCGQPPAEPQHLLHVFSLHLFRQQLVFIWACLFSSFHLILQEE